jgi:hypothetical protein
VRLAERWVDMFLDQVGRGKQARDEKGERE